MQMMLFGVWSRACLRASLLVQCAVTQVETSVQCMNTWRASTPSRPATPAPSVLGGSALLSMPCALILSATTGHPGDLSPNKAFSQHSVGFKNLIWHGRYFCKATTWLAVTCNYSCMKSFSLQPWLMLRSSKIRRQADGAVVIVSLLPRTRPTWGTT